MHDPPSSPVCFLRPSVPSWPLCTHCHAKNALRPIVEPISAVRTGCIKLLDSCLPALDQSAGMLLDVLLTQAQDEWGQVSGPCQTWLQQQAQPSEAGPQVLHVPGSLSADHWFSPAWPLGC